MTSLDFALRKGNCQADGGRYYLKCFYPESSRSMGVMQVDIGRRAIDVDFAINIADRELTRAGLPKAVGITVLRHCLYGEHEPALEIGDNTIVVPPNYTSLTIPRPKGVYESKSGVTLACAQTVMMYEPNGRPQEILTERIGPLAYLLHTDYTELPLDQAVLVQRVTNGPMAIMGLTGDEKLVERPITPQ